MKTSIQTNSQNHPQYPECSYDHVKLRPFLLHVHIIFSQLFKSSFCRLKINFICLILISYTYKMLCYFPFEITITIKHTGKQGLSPPLMDYPLRISLFQFTLKQLKNFVGRKLFFSSQSLNNLRLLFQYPNIHSKNTV